MKIIDTRQLFKPLFDRYMELLFSIPATHWSKPTLASRWKVKDVVSHLLDGDLRVLSIQRDSYFGVGQPEGEDYNAIVNWLNELNQQWVQASNRLSPDVLVMLSNFTGPKVVDYFMKLDLREEAVFPVAWAGEKKSLNWMHIAREYTERWHHQQQIREAVGVDNSLLLAEEYFFLLISTFMLGLPHHFRNIDAQIGTTVKVNIGLNSWYLVRLHGYWELDEEAISKPTCVVSLSKEISWKLFCKNVRVKDILSAVKITGDQRYGLLVLDLVAVMA